MGLILRTRKCYFTKKVLGLMVIEPAYTPVSYHSTIISP